MCIFCGKLFLSQNTFLCPNYAKNNILWTSQKTPKPIMLTTILIRTQIYTLIRITLLRTILPIHLTRNRLRNPNTRCNQIFRLMISRRTFITRKSCNTFFTRTLPRLFITNSTFRSNWMTVAALADFSMSDWFFPVFVIAFFAVFAVSASGVVAAAEADTTRASAGEFVDFVVEAAFDGVEVAATG